MKNIVLIFVFFIVTVNANVKKELVFSIGNGAIIQEISILVLKEAYKRIGIDMIIKIVPNARSLKAANKGRYDGDVSRITGISKKFKNLIQIPVEINFLEAYAFAKRKDLKIENWNSLKDYRVVSVLGIKFVEKNLKKFNIPGKFVSSFTQAMKLLLKERADIAVFPNIVGINALRKAKIKDINITGKRLIMLPLYHYLHKRNKNIAKKLENILLVMKKEGRFAQIRNEYLKNNNY